jgi:hypothetical protein
VEVLGIQQLGLTILEPLSPGERLAFWVFRCTLFAEVFSR